MPYETDIRVPFFAAGPGIAPGTKLDEMVSNIDIAPTLLDLAGIAIPNKGEFLLFQPRCIAFRAKTAHSYLARSPTIFGRYSCTQLMGAASRRCFARRMAPRAPRRTPASPDRGAPTL